MNFRKYLSATVTCVALLFSQTARSSCEYSFDEFINEVRTEREEASAHAHLDCVESTLRYNEIYQILRTAFNENTHYPIPNALLDTILSKFKNPDEHDMTALADSITGFQNDNYDDIEGVISFISHTDLDATGFYKAVQHVAQAEDIESSKRARLFEAIKSTKLYQSEDLLSDSFKEGIFTNLTILAVNKDGEVKPPMEELLFEHLADANDELLKDIATGIHKGTLKFEDSQNALNNLVDYSQCAKRCQSRIIQLITYNEDLLITDRDNILVKIAKRPDTTDYILGDLTMAAWDARIPLKEPIELLRHIGTAENFGAQAKLKMKQAFEQMQLNEQQDKVY